MAIDGFGEFYLIDRLSKHFPQNPDTHTVGIGDDCSATAIDEEFFHLTTTDLLIEDVHFLRDKITPFDLGRKAVSVNVSDIAAMGGIPEHAHLSLALPQNLDLAYLDAFFKGLKNSCDEYSLELLGGDTTKSLDNIVINISIQGRVERHRIKLRSAAKPGDIVCLTGHVGDSGLGLGIILKKWTTTNDDYFIGRHNAPTAHLKEGRWLSQFNGIHAMIDVSDGIASDISHICKQSHVRVQVELKSLPFSTHTEEFLTMMERDRSEPACWGEDYCLLITVEPNSMPDIAAQFRHEFGRPLYKIGTIVAGNGVHFTYAGRPFKQSLSGHDHFRRSS